MILVIDFVFFVSRLLPHKLKVTFFRKSYIFDDLHLQVAEIGRPGQGLKISISQFR